MVRAGLVHADWRVNAKMLWLQGQYARAVGLCRSLPSIDDDHTEQQRLFIAELSLFEELAAAAEGRVAANHASA